MSARLKQKPKFSIASLSLGSCEFHSLPRKIEVAAQCGYDGIELFVPDFEAFVSEVQDSRYPDIPTTTDELGCAKALRGMCDEHGLEVTCLQPFRDFEAFRSGHSVESKLEEAERWMRVMRELKCELMLVCSTPLKRRDLEEWRAAHSFPSRELSPSSHDEYVLLDEEHKVYLDELVDAFTRLSDVAEKFGVRIGYEALSFAAVIDSWEAVWQVVKAVNRDNVGAILDSFNVLGNAFADPAHLSGLRQPALDVHGFLKHMTETLPASKVFFYQIADAALPETPVDAVLDEHGEVEMPPRMVWSRNMRLFPCEKERGAYLPVVEMTSAISGFPNSYSNATEKDRILTTGRGPCFSPATNSLSQLGYSGPWSLEVFNASLSDPEPECLQRHAERGLKGLDVLWDAVTKNEKARRSSCRIL